jgi:prepilin-type N-terminal cleavage/methylation domain-containing protein
MSCFRLDRNVLLRTPQGSDPPGSRGSCFKMNAHDLPRRRWTDERGFTLVETIVALVILTIGILAVATMSSATVWQVRRGQDMTNAALVAQQVMEEITDTPFDSVSVGSFGDTITMGGIDYHVAWIVQDLSDSLASGSNEFKEITVYASGGLTQSSAESFTMAIYTSGGGS